MTFLTPEALRTLDTNGFDGSYQAVGGALSHNCVEVRLFNDANQPVFVSWDGSTDHDFLHEQSSLVYNKDTISNGTQFYVKGEPGEGNFGNIYISAYYSA